MESTKRLALAVVNGSHDAALALAAKFPQIISAQSAEEIIFAALLNSFNKLKNQCVTSHPQSQASG